MTHLRLAPGIPPAGAPMADLAALWVDLIDGMDLDDLFHVVMSPNEGGQIVAHFLDENAMRSWARTFGLPVVAEQISGAVYDLTAAGPVTRNNRSALLKLRATETKRGAA